MNKLSLAYFGSPQFSAQFLERMLQDKNLPTTVEVVITQPDKKVGRKQVVTPSYVKVVAQKHQLLTWDKPIPELKQVIGTLPQVDIALLFAYGEIIPSWLLNWPTKGFWNIHPSLLPQYRGAAPVVFPILLDEKNTGVTLMQMDADLDHGPVIQQKQIEIGPDTMRDKLLNNLSSSGYELFKNSVLALSSGEDITHIVQNHSAATYTRQLNKNDGFIDIHFLKKALVNPAGAQQLPQIVQEFYERNKIAAKRMPAGTVVYNLYRALSPWPGVWTKVVIRGKEKRLKINGRHFKNHKLFITSVQLEGKSPVDLTTCQRAYPGIL